MYFNHVHLLGSAEILYEHFRTVGTTVGDEICEEHSNKWHFWIKARGDTIRIISISHFNFFGSDLKNREDHSPSPFILRTTVAYARTADPSGRL